MAKYLIDVNLPYYFSLWNTPEFIHVKDLGETWSDEKIWLYAKANNLIIITKDADFSAKLILNGIPPKIIHIRIGNMKMKDFHALLSLIWKDILIEIEENSLINVFSHRIEIIK